MNKLSADFYAKIKELRPHYPDQEALLLPALHLAQKEIGYLPQDIMEEIAACLEMHPANILQVASFYTMYNLKPVGKYHMKICTNVACTLRGADELVKYCESKLGVACGETTADGRFTLAEEECLGSCGTAPVMMLNDDYIENLDEKSIDQIIADKH